MNKETKAKNLHVSPADGKPPVVGSANEIITISGGEVQMMRRKWYELYKRGWHKHSNLWGDMMWIRYRW